MALPLTRIQRTAWFHLLNIAISKYPDAKKTSGRFFDLLAELLSLSMLRLLLLQKKDLIHQLVRIGAAGVLITKRRYYIPLALA